MSSAGWMRVNRAERCPICEKPDWCLVSEDKSAVICMRVESNRSYDFSSGNTGWIHDTADGRGHEYASAANAVRVAADRERSVKGKVADVMKLAKQLYLSPSAAAMRLRLADEWSVSVHTLERLWVGAGHDEWNGKSWASCPSRDGSGKVVGIIRRYMDGSKLTYPGTSNAGVFVAQWWYTRPGPVFVVEGMSDVAVLDSIGVSAIGRPSNVGGWKTVSRMIQRRKTDSAVVVVGERDEKQDIAGHEECDGCPRCWPGYYGLEVTAQRLRDSVRGKVVMAMADGKDVREMSSAGRLRQWVDTQCVLATGVPSHIHFADDADDSALTTAR